MQVMRTQRNLVYDIYANKLNYDSLRRWIDEIINSAPRISQDPSDT